ncbi:MAG: Spy/CpxP family protein refolding chaperone [Nitrospirota bacterium]
MILKKLVLLFSLLTAATFLMTGCYKKTPEQRMDDTVQQLVKKLDLNQDQTAKLEEIKAEFIARRPEMQRLREETMQKGNAMMVSPQIDLIQLNELIEKNQRHADNFIRFIGAKFVEIHDMLTPAQRQKLVAEIEDHIQKKKY